MVATSDPKYMEYTNRANAYSESTPNLYNTTNSILNKIKANYYGAKAGLKGYWEMMDRYSRD